MSENSRPTDNNQGEAPLTDQPQPHPKKRNRGSNWMDPDSGTNVRDEDKRRILKDAMSRSALFDKAKCRPAVYTTEDMQRRLEEYFSDCMNKCRRPTLTGMAVALDVSYPTFLDWSRNKQGPYFELLQRARTLVQDFEEQAALEGATNVIYSIFRDKSRWGFVEKSEVVITPNQPEPLGDVQRPEDVARQIEALKAGIVLDDED